MDCGKKGQGNTFWIIIIAVVALVVLVVLLMIFTGKTGDISGGLLDCQSKGGICVICNKDISGNCEEMCNTECGMEGYEDCSYSSVFSCQNEMNCCLGVKKTE